VIQMLVELAFRLHEEGILSRDDLTRIVGECINSVAIENGYAAEHGLPLPEYATSRGPR
jgi:hypothetical protein